MNRIVKGSQAKAPALASRERTAARAPLRLSNTAPRIAFGVTAALAAVSATLLIFGPFSDLSVRQLAAGPHGTALGRDGRPLVLAATGRSWGGEYLRANAASAVETQLAGGPSIVATAREATAK